MSRATDAREEGRIGVFGTSNSFGGYNGRVTNEALGRDLNPLGRGLGQALVAGQLNLGAIAPPLPRRIAQLGQGNSVNNGGGLGMDGGSTDATIRGCCCLVEGIQCQGFAGPPPPRDNCAEYRYRVSVLGQDPCKEENHRLLCECIAYGCNPGGVRGCIPNPYEQYHHCGCEKFGGLDPWKGSCCRCQPGRILAPDGGGGGPKALMSPGGGCCGGGGGVPTQGGRGRQYQEPGRLPFFDWGNRWKCAALVSRARRAIVDQIRSELGGSGTCCGILSNAELSALLSCLEGKPIKFDPTGYLTPDNPSILLCYNFKGVCAGCMPGTDPDAYGPTCGFVGEGGIHIYICCHTGCLYGPYSNDLCTMVDTLIHECWHQKIEGWNTVGPHDPATQARIRKWVKCWCETETHA